MPIRVNIPPATRLFLVSLLAFSLLYNIARWRELDYTGAVQSTPLIPYLTLVPSRFFYYPWTLITATIVEQNIFTVLLNAATIFYGGKYLERAWGSREFSKFIAAVTLIPNAVIIPIYLIWGAMPGQQTRGLTQICGGVAIQASFLVAFKQLVPEHNVAIFKGLVKMRVKHFPALFLLLNALSGIIIGTDTAAVLAWIGILTSWTYLRFYKQQPDLTGTSTNGMGIKGDASETFAFACLFPDVMQPPIAFVADQIYAVLVAVKILRPFSEDDIASGNQQVMARGEAGLPTLLTNQRGGSSRGKREEAERRRALALKALDQRLQAAVSGGRSNAGPSSLAQPNLGQPRPTTPTPSASTGQAMLGGTNYNPDHA
ncbi:uncharacterized protein N7483_005306 [Penicillium malachiteum]|uniref:uncharacterized protein n=1 Tax=Penicillium malachiteum TaxID=1324776 RepID=UPI0025489F9F|nr:uncharacterized protein N7483_005306 [Penicillium malachiteum]KAJ5730798.1 hypothetical protein N7483_005306 [Penicillium malachiteum]